MIRKMLFLLITLVMFSTAYGQSRDVEAAIMPNVNPRSELKNPEGMYAIWINKNTHLLNLSYIRGGQIVLQWADIEKSPGVYDWSLLDAWMKRYGELNISATLQINGNNKPQWMFNEIPYYPGKLSQQVKDKYTLMFWHPRFKRAYLDFIKAWAEHLKQSPYLKNIIGIRMNLNPYGTEHSAPSKYAKDKGDDFSKWVIPKGDTLAKPWNQKDVSQYTKDVLDQFVKELSPLTTVFVRNGIVEELRKEYETDFREGRLAWFHTSSEAESRGNERQYLVFMDYCRAGKTFAYAEPWASAWGEHGGVKDPRFCSPEQWNYWRILMDINCGVSYLATYSSDLDIPVKGMKFGKKVSDSMKKEFRNAFDFGAKYVGQHRYAETTPGVWAAFRQCDSCLCWKKPLKYLTEDYTLLTLVQPGNSVGVHNVGMDESRYGAWARKLPQGGNMSVVMHPVFVKATTGCQLSLRVVYLDEGNYQWNISHGNKVYTVKNTGTGEWKEVVWEVEGTEPLNAAEAGRLVEQGMIAGKNKRQIAALVPDITITAVKGEPIFHMVEVLRR